MASTGPYASLQIAPDRQQHQHSTTLFFAGRMPFLPPNQQRQSTEGKWVCYKMHKNPFFGLGLPWIPVGELRHYPRPQSRLERGIPPSLLLLHSASLCPVQFFKNTITWQPYMHMDYISTLNKSHEFTVQCLQNMSLNTCSSEYLSTQYYYHLTASFPGQPG